jgi:hypothetical protein
MATTNKKGSELRNAWLRRFVLSIPALRARAGTEEFQAK